jgi:hypothetical protein
METHQLRITNITQHPRQANLQKVSSFFHLPRCGGIHAANLAKWNSVSAAGLGWAWTGGGRCRFSGICAVNDEFHGGFLWISYDFRVFGDFLKAFAPLIEWQIDDVV